MSPFLRPTFARVTVPAALIGWVSFSSLKRAIFAALMLRRFSSWQNALIKTYLLLA